MTTRKSLAWAFNQQFFQYVLQFGGSVIIARLLTPGEIGIFSLAMAASWLLASLRQFGVGNYLIRERELNREKIRTAFGIIVTISWFLGLVMFVARDFIAELYGAPGIADVMILLAVNFFIAPLGQVANGLLARDMRFDILHHVTLAGTAIGTATSITLAFMGFSYMSLAWGLLIASLARAGMLFWVRPGQVAMRPSFLYWRDVVSFGGFLTANSIANTVNSQGNKFILGGLITPGAVALVERAGQIPSIARKSLVQPLVRVLIPAFSQDIREGSSIGPGVVKLVAATTVIIWPFLLTLGLLAVPIIVFIFGENWRVAGEILPFILIPQAIYSLFPDAGQILIPHGRVKRLLLVSSGMTISNIVITTAGAWHSLEMFAMLRPVHGIVAAIVTYWGIRAYWQADGVRLLRAYGQAIVVALISALPALGVLLLYGWTVPLWALIFVALSAPLLWLASLFLVRHPVTDEMLHILRAVLARLRHGRESSPPASGQQ